MCRTDSAIVHETSALELRLIALHALDRPGAGFRHCLVATIEFGDDPVLDRRRKFLRMVCLPLKKHESLPFTIFKRRSKGPRKVTVFFEEHVIGQGSLLAGYIPQES